MRYDFQALMKIKKGERSYAALPLRAMLSRLSIVSPDSRKKE
jgi:hypothetical protein